MSSGQEALSRENSLQCNPYLIVSLRQSMNKIYRCMFSKQHKYFVTIHGHMFNIL